MDAPPPPPELPPPDLPMAVPEDTDFNGDLQQGEVHGGAHAAMGGGDMHDGDTEMAMGTSTDMNNTGPVVVTDQMESGEKAEKTEARSENCCEKFLKCLSHVPCASLIAWIILLLGLGGLCGSLLIGAQKTRVLLGNDSILWFLEFTMTGLVVAMFVLGTVFLIIGYVSSEPSSRRIFNSTAKNKCARGVNIFLLIFVYILTICWLLVTALLTVPVVMIALPYITNNNCFNLETYGFQDKEMCDEELNVFKTSAKDVLICYGVGYISAVLIIVSLIHFLICISANLTHLKDSRFATLNAYETEELRNSKHSVIDTNM